MFSDRRGHQLFPHQRYPNVRVAEEAQGDKVLHEAQAERVPGI